jgi:soluble lytic murein transglycosylase
VMRNYWMYQQQAGEKTPSMAALAQGMWPKFPGMAGPQMVRLDRVSGVQSAD